MQQQQQQQKYLGVIKQSQQGLGCYLPNLELMRDSKLREDSYLST